MRIERTVREFGIKLAAGVSCGPGTLIGVDSNGTGVLGDDTGSVYAHGVALTSGSGTKTPGISQYVNCHRNAQVADLGDLTLTPGNVLYLGDAGLISNTAPGTIDQVVGFALNATTAFIDISTQSLI
jgi:hypothetical protein